MTRELTPSEYEDMVASTKNQPSGERPNYLRPALLALGVILLCALSFAAGEKHQKSQNVATPGAASSRSANGIGFDRSGGQRPNIGQVTAVSSDSITVKNDRTGEARTFKITSSTTVTNGSSAAAVTDIQTGDTVMVQADTTDTGTATRIVLNPTFNGPGAAVPTGASSTSTVSN